MSYEFHPAAEAEFLESVGFYDSRVRGLGAAFIAEFERTIELIAQSPEQRPLECAPDIRRAPMHRFPFSLLYRERRAVIQILAVAHDRRRPQYWLGRV